MLGRSVQSYGREGIGRFFKVVVCRLSKVPSQRISSPGWRATYARSIAGRREVGWEL